MQVRVGEEEVEEVDRFQNRREASCDTVASRFGPSRSAGEEGEKASEVTPSR